MKFITILVAHQSKYLLATVNHHDVYFLSYTVVVNDVIKVNSSFHIPCRYFAHVLPSDAKGNSTRFRFWQPKHGGIFS